VDDTEILQRDDINVVEREEYVSVDLLDALQERQIVGLIPAIGHAQSDNLEITEYGRAVFVMLEVTLVTSPRVWVPC